jgi:hypothetical protein
MEQKTPQTPTPVRRSLLGGVKSFFKGNPSKREQKELKAMSTKSKKLPKNFANLVLDYELQIDSG